ncbi:MAG: phosphoribosyltransferase [Cyclobacteriaceae bacterium]
MRFEDREDAARQLAQQLKHYKSTDSIVLGIPRGGVPMAYYIAEELDLPLDVVLAKKLGHPDNPELAIGAISLEGASISEKYHVSQAYIDSEIERVREELKRRRKEFTGDGQRIPLKNKHVILTDDGIATGRTVQATVELLKNAGARKITIAVPVTSPHAEQMLRREVDEFISLMSPEDFRAVGQFYENYEQTSDEEVSDLLHKAQKNSRNT